MRLGGDEFAILLHGDGTDDAAAAVAGAVVAALREPFEVAGTTVSVGASVGVACRAGAVDRSELMRRADIAMYRVKTEGRDGFRLFTEDMNRGVELRRELERDLRDALARGRDLVVHYQPQLDAAGTRVIGLEALVRWNHPRRGLLPPATFVPVAEEAGLIGELGRRVFRDACAVARDWPGLSVAVNLSPVQFRMRGFADELIAIARAEDVPPRQIELEVTEATLLDDDELAHAALDALRRFGFRLALDDFGTGYSSLGYLNRFGVDKIKIDRSFTGRLGEAAEAGTIIHAVVRLGHAMGLSVSAEGVETADQRAFLEGAGCNEVQGFLFSAAVPQADLGEVIGRPRAAA